MSLKAGSGRLSGVLSSRAPEGLRASLEAAPELERRLAHVLSEARAAWPGVDVEDAAFLERLAAHMAREGDVEAALASVHAADLYLAAACAAGDAKAIAALERRHISEVPRSLARMSPAADFVEEVKQRLRERLLIGEGGRPPKIAEYGGRGPLSAWVRVAATRVALGMRRSGKRAEKAPGTLSDVASPSTNPEAAVARGQRRRALKAALEEALCALEPEDRELLRLHVLGGQTVEEIGASAGVHASTVSRRIAKARAKVLKATQRELGRMGLGRAEVESLINSVGGQLDVSLQRVLGATAEDQEPQARSS